MAYAQSARQSPPPMSRHASRLVGLVAIFTIILHYSYVFTYNYSPESIRLVIVAIFIVIHFGMALFAIGKKAQMWQAAMLLSLALTLASIMISHGIYVTSNVQTLPELLRNTVIFAMPLWLLAFPEHLPHRLMITLVLFGTLLGGVIALVGNPVYVSGTPRLGSITGGLTQMHPSAKFITLQLILIHQYYNVKMISAKIAIPCMLFAGAILFGYGGRNEMLFTFVYFLSFYYFTIRKNHVLKWLPFIITALLVIAAAVALHFGENVNDWGSGRIGVWQHRFGLIWNRDLLTFIFGGGLGADQIWNPQWWWMEDATAHNDFLHIIMETGLIGFIASIIFLGALLFRLPGRSKAIALAMVVESIFSNGQFQSPMTALSYFLLASASIFCWHRQFSKGSTQTFDEQKRQNILQPSRYTREAKPHRVSPKHS